MKVIKAQKIRNARVQVPGSKSYTHRLLICTALSDGLCEIRHPLKSEDTCLTAAALSRMGADISECGDHFQVQGVSGRLQPCTEPIFLGNSGTSMRLLTAVAALGRGAYTLTGTERMQERPIRDLLEGLHHIGVRVRSIHSNGCPPVVIEGGKVAGGCLSLDCAISSQYLSALLLIGPYTRGGLDITVTRGPVSKPYVDMTIAVMERCGVPVERDGYQRFKIPPGLHYRAGTYTVEPDCSQAGYFWAAAAVTGACVTVSGITADSLQGDLRFLEVLQQMGCRVRTDASGASVEGGSLRGVDVDMADMPDLVPTLAVVAAFAEGTTVIRNVAHLRAKESDRLAAVAAELGKMDVAVTCTDSGLVIEGGRPAAARIDTYGDHRIAMSFAVAGLVVPGVVIADETVVVKSFPNFWDVFEGLYTPVAP